MRFHRRCGDRVTLLNDNTTAIRNFVEFNHGLILSAEPIVDDVMFEVCVDRKVNVWNGSLEIGVTTLDPEHLDLPATATKLRNTAWIMSGSSIIKDGITQVNSYGPELDTLREGDCVGVMRTSKAELMFYVNGRCLGVAVRDLPHRLYAVIDLYGQCVQVSIVNTVGMRPIMENSLDQIEEDPNNDDKLTASENEPGMSSELSYPKCSQNLYIPMASEGACAYPVHDSLRFHPRCGILVKLSSNNKTAERARPLDDYNNGVVMTHRPLYDNELFEIRIDRLVDKWSGSIEVGLTTHNPATIRFPSTMTNMDSGTIMMSGCKLLLNGHATYMEYGNFNLDELREGDTVGLMRKASGKLHYYINGIDQGVATDNVDQQVWGVVDLYGMTVKVSIVDSGEYVDTDLTIVPVGMEVPEETTPSRFSRPTIDEDSLLFHTLRDSNVIIINDGKTAHRPNAFKLFNNGIVMTNRTLKTNELFQVRLDLVIPKWAGSIEIGVTQHSSNDLQFPFKMSNAKSGIWAMTGEDIIKDGTVIFPQYVRNLNRLVEGDTVGVMRKDMRILHFYVNGVDQGPAAFNVPDHVFGIIDLYGRVAQATIVDAYSPVSASVYIPESPLSTDSNATVYPEMCFHRVHGRNARLGRSRLTASRATVYSEFNDAVLFSSRPLRECDMFELRIDKMVDCWIGSIEIGVTAIRPEELEASGGVGAVAGTATDLVWDTYILSGAAVMKDGECVRSGYKLDLDTLTVGSRVGMMWHADRSLHYYLDGMDMGRAWYVPHLNIYAVVDLYGQCTQVTILPNEERAFNFNGCTNSDNSLLSNSRIFSSPPPPYWSFSEYCGENVSLTNDYSIARRLTLDPTGALVFSSAHLVVGEIFEIKITECKSGYAGSMRMGVTDINILNAHVNRNFPSSVAYLPHYTSFVDGKYMKCSQAKSREHDMRSFVPSFEWLRPGDRVGLLKATDGRVLVYYNSEQLDTAFEDVPDKVYAVIELYGHITKVQAVTRGPNWNLPTIPTIPNDGCDKQSQNITMDADKELAAVCNANKTIIETSVLVEVKAEGAEETNVAGTSCTSESHDDQVTTESVVTTETKSRRRSLPYTFYYIHGANIKLCSSNTVAMRTDGYKEGIAIVSQPLKKGSNFRFRVDKLTSNWYGGIMIGAVGALPDEELPPRALDLQPPVWVVSSEVINDNGFYKLNRKGSSLDSLDEMSVLTLNFRCTGELILDLDGETVGVIGTVPRTFSHVYPMVDLYGSIVQVSILLHPYVIASGTSLDLPTITENLWEEFLAELDLDGNASRPVSSTPTKVKTKHKAHSEENLQEGDLQRIFFEPGPSTQDISQSLPTENNFSSLPASSTDNDIANRQLLSDDNNMNDQSEEGLGEEFDESILYEDVCDTNIRHNDRYPETINDVDNDIINALMLETGNLPDLSEDSSSPIDDPSRRQMIWSQTLSYLHHLLSLDQEQSDDHNLDSEWGPLGESCEHLHSVLKYWNYLVLQFPELQHAVSWGQIRCYCYNCQPDSQSPFAGWVRIERVEGVRGTSCGYWHVGRAVLAAARGAGPRAAPHRPILDTAPTVTPPFTDIWFDEEGKPHQTVIVLEIDLESSDPSNDHLSAFQIYLKPYVFMDDSLPSFED